MPCIPGVMDYLRIRTGPHLDEPSGVISAYTQASQSTHHGLLRSARNDGEATPQPDCSLTRFMVRVNATCPLSNFRAENFLRKFYFARPNTSPTPQWPKEQGSRAKGQGFFFQSRAGKNGQTAHKPRVE